VDCRDSLRIDFGLGIELVSIRKLTHTLKGRLVLGQESTGLRTIIDNLLASGITRIVVNLKHVNYVDSAGLGALIEMHRYTKAKGGSLKL